MTRPHYPVTFIFAMIVLCQLIMPVNTRASGRSTIYAIVLASTPGRQVKWVIKKYSAFNHRTIYSQAITVKGKAWQRLCVGFYTDYKQARAAQEKIKKRYPDAWITRTSKNTIKRIISSPENTNVSAPPVTKHTIIHNQSTLTEKQINELMQKARQSFNGKKYRSAIRYLTALVEAGKHKYSQDALEQLGLARQRLGQKERAAKTYARYIKLYPSSKGTPRVKQRLAGLLTASKPARKKIHLLTVQKKNEISSYGNLSQFYRWNRASTDNAGSVVTLSQLVTFLDTETLVRSNSYDQRFRFTADHTHDFVALTSKDDLRFIETYYELTQRRTGHSGKIGRQALRIGGILKRFDGISLGYQINPEMRLNFLGGLPVDIQNKTSFNKHKFFYGFIYETGTFLKNWNMNLFYFDQKIDGLTDRNSAGTEVHYNDRNRALFGMIDYDLFYKKINILQLNANILFAHGRSAYMNAFMREAPILATSNALIGQQARTISDLKKNLNIEQIYQLANDRTASSQTVTIGGTQPINEKFQSSVDITLSRVGSTVSSGGVAATPSTGTDYFLSAQIVGNNLLINHDTGVIGIRFNNTTPSNTLSLIANSRFPISRNWRINPRLQLDYRKLQGSGSQTKYRALLRTDYRYLNKVRFDFEIGYDATTSTNINNDTLGTNNLFFTLGYRWDFY